MFIARYHSPFCQVEKKHGLLFPLSSDHGPVTYYSKTRCPLLYLKAVTTTPNVQLSVVKTVYNYHFILDKKTQVQRKAIIISQQVKLISPEAHHARRIAYNGITSVKQIWRQIHCSNGLKQQSCVCTSTANNATIICYRGAVCHVTFVS